MRLISHQHPQSATNSQFMGYGSTNQTCECNRQTQLAGGLWPRELTRCGGIDGNMARLLSCDYDWRAEESTTVARSSSADRSTANPLLYVFMNTMVATVRSDTTDLTARQLAVFLKTYLEPETEHTVRRLAADLNISKPAITRALDRLTDSDFIRREKDANDRRSVIVRRTSAGSAYLRTLSGYVNDADKLAAKQTAKTA
jgi:DNA-binding MarR family transcriptional regulator